MSRRRCLLVLTKPARPGRVKTRLIGELTARQAADLHQAFVADLLDRLTGQSYDLRLFWALEPGEVPPIAPVASYVQQGDDLGTRLRLGLEATLRDYPSAVAIGSDHPDLPLHHLDAAFEALEGGADLALGPAIDGGYYLIGARSGALRAELFEAIEWSTATVFADTLAKAHRLGLKVEILGPARDVDTAADLRHLALSLAADPGACPRTFELLKLWGRLPAAEPIEVLR